MQDQSCEPVDMSFDVDCDSFAKDAKVYNHEKKAESDPALATPFGLTQDVDEIMGFDTRQCYRTLKQKEARFLHFRPQAKYIKYRRLLVDWMCEVGDELQLHSTTNHVAILYLDRILQSVPVPKQHLQLVAVSCLLIAAKMEEAEEAVPSVADLNEYSQREYSRQMICQMETEILLKLDWELTAITPLHFLEYFISKGSLYTDDLMIGRAMQDTVPKYMWKYAHFFAELALQDYEFQQYSPSLLASAILKACRKALHISPHWRPELTALTGYCEEEVNPCYHHVWRHYIKTFPAVDSDKAQSTDSSPTAVSDVPH